MGIPAKIARAVDAFMRWMWNGLNPPPRKKWCIAVYLVAAEESFEYPEGNGLNDKMLEAVEAIKKASKATGLQDVHIAYRTIDEDYQHLAEVMSWLPFHLISLGPKDYEFDGCPVSEAKPFNTGDDMRCFFEWVYKWCPADHYAFFFWGHSFGPAGLFEKYATIQVPQPGLAFLRKAFEAFTTRRAADLTPQGPIVRLQSSPTPSTASGSPSALDVVRDFANAKVELAVFHSCWMSTLETAYELQGVVQASIGSQSLVPVGQQYLKGEFIWPFEDVFTAIAGTSTGQTAGRKVIPLIETFYKNKWALVTGLSSVPFSLLDLTKLGAITTSVKALVAAVGANTAVLSQGVIGPQTAGLQVGDLSLVDLRQLCSVLASQPSAASADATTLDTVLYDAILASVDVNATNGSGFTGLSAFFYPPNYIDGSSFIADAMVPSVYDGLQFPIVTKWPGVSQMP